MDEENHLTDSSVLLARHGCASALQGKQQELYGFPASDVNDTWPQLVGQR
jgi:hypothetical protein